VTPTLIFCGLGQVTSLVVEARHTRALFFEAQLAQSESRASPELNSRELFMLAVVISQPSAYSSTAPYFEAAFEAGFPETVRLLEEPQAAFYGWLELHQLVCSS